MTSLTTKNSQLSLTSSENIKVILRVRPKIENEYNQNCSCLKIDGNSIIATSRSDSKQFTFDYIATEESSQSEIFIQGAKDICDSVLQGYNGTIFVYGQTGAGKTYTLLGPNYSLSNKNNNLINEDYNEPYQSTNLIYEELNKGILPRTIDYLFIKSKSMEGSKVNLSCSFIEIYMEQVSDLLNPSNNGNKSLNIQCTGEKVIVDGLSKLSIDSPEEAYSLILKGSKLRHIASTNMNKESSRSHAIFSIYLDNKTFDKNKNSFIIKKSVFHLIDLAGSERQKAAETTGERLKEAGIINKSLMNLSFVIKNLSENSNLNKHIHFRDSKLTLLLKDSLGGNAKTCIIANISPAYGNISETISTLSFAQRAKMIKNKAIINEVCSNNDLNYQKEIVKLKEKYNAIKSENYYLLSLIEKKKINNNNVSDDKNQIKESNFAKTIDSVENEIETMLNEISIKEETINSLKKEETFLRDKVQKYQLDITLKEKEINETEQKIEANQKMHKEMLGQIKEYYQQNSDLAKELSEKQEEINFCQMENNKEINKFKNIIECTNKIFDEKNEAIQHVSEEKNKKIVKKTQNHLLLNTIEKDISNTQNRIENLNDNLKKHKEDIESKKALIEKKKIEILEKKEEISKFQQKIEKIHEKHQKFLDEFEYKIKNIPKLINEIENDILSYKSKKNEIEMNIQNNNIIKEKYDDLLSHSKNEITKLLEQMKNIMKNKTELEKQLSRINEENEKLQKEVNLLSISSTDAQPQNSIANKIMLLNKTKHENTKLKEKLNEIKRAYDSLQRNTKNLSNLQKENQIKPNIFVVSNYLSEKDNELSSYHLLMEESLKQIMEIIPPNGIENEENIENKLTFYFDKFIEKNSKISKDIENFENDIKNKNDLISSLKRELLIVNNTTNNLNYSLSCVSNSERNSLEKYKDEIKRNSANMSSLVKTASHAKIYKSVFCTKRKYDDYIPLNFETENKRKCNFDFSLYK